MASDSTLTAERVRELLDYDPLTGVFTWRVRQGKGRIGQRAGSPMANGYREICVDGLRTTCHRMAWFYTFGVWPPCQLDHRDNDPSNDRLANLREASPTQNGQNKHRPYRNNRSGFQGVIAYKDRWRAFINVGPKQHYLGTFTSVEDAGAVYQEAKSRLHPFAN